MDRHLLAPKVLVLGGGEFGEIDSDPDVRQYKRVHAPRYRDPTGSSGSARQMA